MSQSPKTAVPEPAGARSQKGAPVEAGPEISDPAVVPLADLFPRSVSESFTWAMMLLGFGVQDALGVTVTASTNVVAVGNPVILNCLDMIQKIHAHRRASAPAI